MSKTPTLNVNQPHIDILSPISDELYQQGDYVVVGMSPFNSYFSCECIQTLLAWCDQHFAHVVIFLPDNLPVYNFLAMGYSLARAQKKCKRQVNYLTNKIRRAIDALGIRRTIPLYLMSELELEPAYRRAKLRCDTFYQQDDDFQAVCHQSVREMLRSYHQSPADSDLAIAVKYLLYEIPLLLYGPAVFDIPNALFLYHEIPAFIDYLYQKQPLPIHPQQGFIRVQFDQGMVESSP